MQQQINPNLDPVIYIDGQALLDWYGWCLAFVRTAFGTPFAGDNAWQGWTNYANNKHEDRNIPSGVYVPIWFSGYGGLGHVAIYKDGQVWSSPWEHKPTADLIASIEEVERIYGVTYAGWSEGLGGTIVISPTPTLPYTIEAIEAKQVTLNKNTHLWNLSFDNFTAIDTHPVADAAAGTVLTVNAQLHHNIGYTYYLTNPSVPNGYNTLDCDDFVVPPLPPPAPPAAPLVIANSETYELVVELTGYTTSNQAINRKVAGKSATVQVPAGTYFIYNKTFDSSDQPKLLSVNVTKTSGTPGAWINVADNVVALPVVAKPEVLAAETSEPDFAKDYVVQKPELYVAMDSLTATNLVSGKTVTMPKYSVTWISGTVDLNDTSYAIVQSGHDKGQWWGIEWVGSYTRLPNLELETAVFDAKTSLSDRQATKTITKSDHLLLAVASVKHIYLGFVGFLGKISSANKNKKD